jgi:enoyl-CoA hydratase
MGLQAAICTSFLPAIKYFHPMLCLLDYPCEGVARLTLNRPNAANALSSALASDIINQIQIVNQNPALRVLVLAGAGRHFCAGADLKERRGLGEADWQAQHALFRAARAAIAAVPVPVLAAVQGAAFGGGCELALACDCIYAAEDARFALTEASLGIMPGMGGTQALPRAIGYAQAAELLFLAEPFDAPRALALGMVNALFAPEALMEQVLARAGRMASRSPLSLRAIKRALRRGAALPFDEAFAVELAEYNRLLSTHDRHEGINAYNEKRPPRFTGE